MKKFRTVASVIIMVIAGIVGFFIGAFLNEPMAGTILFSMIAGIACIVYAIDNHEEQGKFKFDEEVLYMNKSISRIIGVIMLIVAFVFIMFALNHPEKSFPWNNTITWLLYGVYFLVTVVLLIAPKMKK